MEALIYNDSTPLSTVRIELSIHPSDIPMTKMTENVEADCPV